MKKTILFIFTLTVLLSSVACKNKVSKTTDKQEKIAQLYSINAKDTKINWTAYKTTDKIAVKGQFNTLNIKKSSSAATIKETLNGTEFSIPVSSIFSNNEDRDNKLKTFFFGVMKNTELLSGTITVENDANGFVDFAMNGVVEKLPFTYTIDENNVHIKATMHLETWQALAAADSLNKVCFDLHKAADGVSKLWNEVGIEINVPFTLK